MNTNVPITALNAEEPQSHSPHANTWPRVAGVAVGRSRGSLRPRPGAPSGRAVRAADRAGRRGSRRRPRSSSSAISAGSFTVHTCTSRPDAWAARSRAASTTVSRPKRRGSWARLPGHRRPGQPRARPRQRVQPGPAAQPERRRLAERGAQPRPGQPAGPVQPAVVVAAQADPVPAVGAGQQLEHRGHRGARLELDGDPGVRQLGQHLLQPGQRLPAAHPHRGQLGRASGRRSVRCRRWSGPAARRGARTAPRRALACTSSSR